MNIAEAMERLEEIGEAQKERQGPLGELAVGCSTVLFLIAQNPNEALSSAFRRVCVEIAHSHGKDPAEFCLDVATVAQQAFILGWRAHKDSQG